MSASTRCLEDIHLNKNEIGRGRLTLFKVIQQYLNLPDTYRH